MRSDDRGRQLQDAAQAMVDWYSASYGPRRARRYLGACERRGLRLPEAAGRGKASRPLVIGIALALLVLGSLGLGEMARTVAPGRAARQEVLHEHR